MNSNQPADSNSNHSKFQLPVTIRAIRVDEIQQAMDLQEQSIRTLSSADYSPEEVAAILTKAERFGQFGQGRITLVAEYQQEMVGYATLAKQGSIDAVFVHPQFVRQGVGRQLVVALEQEALQRRIKCLIIFSSLTAVNFYQSLGYKADRKVFLSNTRVKVPCMFMTKQLIPFTLWDRIYGVFGLIFLVLAVFVVVVGAIALFLGMLFLIFSVLR